MRRAAAVVILVLLLAPVRTAGVEPPDGHGRMVELLAEMAARDPIRAARDQQVSQLRTRLFELRRAVSDVQRLGIRRNLGQAYLLAGRPYDALDNFEQMLRETRVLTRSQALPVSLTANFWLGVTHLYLSTRVNCAGDAPPDRCRLPLEGSWEAGNEDWLPLAQENLERTLQLSRPGTELALAARWLLHVVHHARGVEPDGLAASIQLSPDAFGGNVGEAPRLADAAPQLGLDVESLSGGMLVEDLDGDGWLDVMTSSADLGVGIRTFRNDAGSFVEVTEESGLDGITGGHNLVQADYDGDGDLDVLVLRGGWLGTGGSLPNSLLRNEGGFTFTDVTFASGLGEEIYPGQVGAWADFDRDGDLDLFVGNEAITAARFPSQLFRNREGRFSDVAAEAGIRVEGLVKGAAWGDVDEDGWPDLFVSVFDGANRLFRNRRDGTFEDVSATAGVQGPRFSYTSWFFDADEDGHLDLLVASYRPGTRTTADVWYWLADLLGLEHPGEPLHLYLGAGDGTFTESAGDWNIGRVTLATGGNFGDIDNDGRLDVYLATGYPGYDSLVPDLLYRNRGGGGFEDATYTTGIGDLRRGAAVAFADFDNDGDQDVFVKRGGLLPDDLLPDAVYQNPSRNGNALAVELRAADSNRFAVGARVRARLGDGRTLSRWMGQGSSFGTSPLRLHLGLGEAERIERLEVIWPSGATQTFADLPAGTRVLLREGDDRARVLERRPSG